MEDRPSMEATQGQAWRPTPGFHRLALKVTDLPRLMPGRGGERPTPLDGKHHGNHHAFPVKPWEATRWPLG